MKRLKKIVFWVLGVLLSLILVAVAIIHFQLESWIDTAIQKKMPSHIHLTYSQLEANVLKGNLNIRDIGLSLHSPDATEAHTYIELPELSLDGFSYLPWLKSRKIDLNGLTIPKARITHYPHRQYKDSTQVDSSRTRTISIDALSIPNISYQQLQPNDSLAVDAPQMALQIKGLVLDRDSPKQEAFSYESMELTATQLHTSLSPYEALTIDSLSYSPGTALLKGVQVNTKYTRNELAKVLYRQHTHSQTRIASIRLDSLYLGKNGERPFLTASQMAVDQGKAIFFRNKLLPEDTRFKPMYSQMLRELPLDLAIGKVLVTNSDIRYSERVKPGGEIGFIEFNNIQATIKRLGNTYQPGAMTEVEATTDFMDITPIHLKWGFDVQDQNDTFTANGSVKNFHTESINTFIKGHLHAQAEGTIHNIYFNIYGNGTHSQGDIKMRYDDFHVTFYHKKNFKVNKFMTGLANFFINDGSHTDEEGYRFGKIAADRNTQKAFWNYLWVNVRHGIAHTMTIKGKAHKKK